MFKDIIDILLQKKSTLEADREAEKALACERIDAEYADRAGKIDGLLDMAGYVPPVIEEAPEAAAEAEAVENTPTEAERENVAQTSTMNVY